MKIQKMNALRLTVIISCIILALGVPAFGQGRGRGSGGGGGRPSGSPGGPPASTGVDRGIDTASDRSNGRSDNGMGRASDRSNGRSAAGIDRARLAENNRRDADKDLRDHPAIADSLHVTANDLRAGYAAALTTNPNLKFGQYVAATRLANNLGSRFPNVTRDNILAGLAAGHSLGQTLQTLGLSSDQADAAKREADREFKDSKKSKH